MKKKLATVWQLSRAPVFCSHREPISDRVNCVRFFAIRNSPILTRKSCHDISSLMAYRYLQENSHVIVGALVGGAAG
ncbi:hypothetical protein [Pantoea sp.]|uniref:hypothetical protein n=1 Tax=Pantoea sp. TaxID=69393 RepID=UPI0028ADAE83|nr:hypothetical protein [Pantoea sp.]